MVDLVNLSKEEIVKRAKWQCPIPGHSKHNGLAHPRCYDKFKHVEGEKVGYLDIETEDLKADFGIIFNWCILDAKTNKVYRDVLTPEDIKKHSSRDRDKQPREDSRIIRSLIERLNDYDRVVTHYGCRFDLPFIRTRAVICEIPFPSFGLIYQTDTWMILKNKFKLSRNSLQNGMLKLKGFSRKDHLSLSIKHGCLRGEKWALDLSDKHCENDVLDLRDLHQSIESYANKTKSSI
jgi:hypothetical protein